jgi:translocation protein SEC66
MFSFDLLKERFSTIFSASALIPVAYLVLVLGSLVTFSTFYRRRKALESSNLEPWFPEHHERNVYLTLLHMDPPCPPKLLKAALLERAKEDITRIYTLRESKNAAHGLLQKGSISESLFQQLVAAEAEMNVEMQDVIAEAKGLGGDDWAQSIVPQANEYYQKSIILKTIEQTQKFGEREKENWEKEKELRKAYEEQQREIALRELSEENSREVVGKVDGDNTPKAEIPNGSNPETPAEKKSKKKKNRK